MAGMRCDGCGEDVRGQDTVEDTPYLTNVRAIEHFTGNRFFCNLPQGVQDQFERTTATQLWPEQ
jgi:hypothetical protein